MCNNCIHKAVCSIYRATGGVKKCEHHKEERKGHWVTIPKERLGLEWGWRCNICGLPQDYKHKYCANCGAKMEGASERLVQYAVDQPRWLIAGRAKIV